LDINYKHRFFNGSDDTIEGSILGLDYSADFEVDQTSQLTIGYNHVF